MEIDWWTLTIQTVNFLVVVWLLGRFLYRPVRRMIEAREASDRAAAEDAQARAEAADRLRADYESRLAAFEEEKRKREAELHETLQRGREEALAAARKQAKAMRDTARVEIEEAHARALAYLRDDIAALAKDLAAKALSVATNPVVGLEGELDRQPDDALSRMKQDLAEGGAVTVVTAAALPEETRESVRTALWKRLGDRFEAAFETDADLLGGILLRLPHGVLDASVAGRLKAAADAMNEGENGA